MAGVVLQRVVVKGTCLKRSVECSNVMLARFVLEFYPGFEAFGAACLRDDILQRGISFS